MFNMRVYDVTNSMVAPSRGSRRKNLLDLFQGSTLAGVAPNMPKIVSKSGNRKPETQKNSWANMLSKSGNPEKHLEDRFKIWKPQPKKHLGKTVVKIWTPQNCQKAPRQKLLSKSGTPQKHLGKRISSKSGNPKKHLSRRWMVALVFFSHRSQTRGQMSN